VRGNRWYLSSVTIWEILLTSDEKKKEDILYLSQQLFFEKLLCSPSELIIKYILKGCPLYENKFDIHSKSRLQHVWDDLCKDKNKTFIYDKKQLQTKTKHVQIISRQLFKIINRIVIDSKPSDFGSRLDLFLSSHTRRLRRKTAIINTDPEKLYKIALLFMLYILCMEADFDATPIKEYWKDVGVSDTFKRLGYLLNKYEILTSRGPFMEMAITAFEQIRKNNKSTRGLFFDCLHSIYLPYVDIFLTYDNHFRNLSRIPHINYQKIYHFDELQITEYLRKIVPPEKTQL
jgi:hypothetical protein